MAQIAQQDHLYVDDPGKLTGLQKETKDFLKKCVEDHTILEVVLRHKETENTINVSKVIGYEKDITIPEAPTYKVVFVNTNTGVLSNISL